MNSSIWLIAAYHPRAPSSSRFVCCQCRFELLSDLIELSEFWQVRKIREFFCDLIKDRNGDISEAPNDIILILLTMQKSPEYAPQVIAFRNGDPSDLHIIEIFVLFLISMNSI